MARGKILNKNPQEGDIKIMPSNNTKWIYTNGKWVYIKKPKGYFKKDQPKKKTVYNYPPIKLPPHIKETQYVRYYISENGDAYRVPGKYDRNEQYGKINEWGLIYLKPALRGHPKYPEKQYHCINISITDENGKYKQIKKYNHQLVAETYVDNPHGYTEIMHLDENNKNNHYTNLKWGTHLENMDNVISPCTNPKTYKITDTTTGKIWSGTNIAEWVRQNYDLVIPRMKSSNHKLSDIAKHLANARSLNSMIWKFKVEHGV